jgi:hypothetical protein
MRLTSFSSLAADIPTFVLVHDRLQQIHTYIVLERGTPGSETM